MKKYGIIVLLTLFMILPIKVNALTGSISISCSPNSVSSGDTVECSVTGTSDVTVSQITTDIDVNDDLSISSFQPNQKWTKNSDSTSSINVVASEDVSGNFELGVLTIKVNDSAAAGDVSVKLTSVVFYDTDLTEVDVSNATATIKIEEENSEEEQNSGLESLEIVNGTISPAFDASVTSYSVTISSNTFGLNMKAANSSDKITVVEGEMESLLKADNITFQPNEQGMMLINIRVGTGFDAVEYVLIVKKEGSDTGTNSENLLSSLTVGGKKINLEAGKLDYEVTLSSNIGYKVRATLSDPDNYAFDEFNNGNGTFSGNDFIITINPIDPSSGLKSVTYRIVVKTSSSNSGGNSQNVSSNPSTSDVPMVLMALVLVVSLIISVTMYKKNMDAYN